LFIAITNPNPDPTPFPRPPIYQPVPKLKTLLNYINFVTLFIYNILILKTINFGGLMELGREIALIVFWATPPTQRNCSISPSSLIMTIVIYDMVKVGLILPADNSALTENLPTLYNDKAECQL